MIDPKLQAELRAKYNPDGSDLRKMQLRMLDMLKYIDKICQENNIKYWLSSGTCLGAVRHGGFIPWDDDCDIEMLESDYRKLQTIMSRLENPKYILQTYKNDKSYFPRFGKLRDPKSYLEERGPDRMHFYNGIYVDVFPLRKSSSEQIHKLGRYPLWLFSMRMPSVYHNKFIMRTLQYFGQISIYILSFILNTLQLIGRKRYLRHTSPNYFSTPRVFDEILPTKYIKFEDTYLPVPFNYHNYLTRLYGDYMSLPTISLKDNSVFKHITKLIIEE